MTTTSLEQQKVEMARKGYEAFNEADIAAAMDTMEDDVLWHVGGDHPLTGEYQGRDQVMQMLGRFGQLTEGTYEADVHDILASEDHTVVIGTYTATRHGRTHSSRFVDIIHSSSTGKAKEFWRFNEDQGAEDQFFKE